MARALICVDGSGPDHPQDYRHAMWASFVTQTHYHAARDIDSYYWRGPTMLNWQQVSDLELVSMARDGAFADGRHRALMDRRGWHPGDELYLTGWSRGAATVIQLAWHLSIIGVPVEAMFIYDAVDRSPWIGEPVGHITGNGVETVPPNVKHTYHAIRHVCVADRVSFDYSGVRSAASSSEPVVFERVPFVTSHGGTGGWLWGYTGLRNPENYLRAFRRGDAHSLRWYRTIPRLGGDEYERLFGWVPNAFDGDGATEEPDRDPHAGANGLNINMVQEEEGSLECLAWMWERLRRHRVVELDYDPYVAFNRSPGGDPDLENGRFLSGADFSTAVFILGSASHPPTGRPSHRPRRSP